MIYLYILLIHGGIINILIIIIIINIMPNNLILKHFLTYQHITQCLLMRICSIHIIIYTMYFTDSFYINTVQFVRKAKK